MALKISASQREVLDATFGRTANWNGHAMMPEPMFMWYLGVRKLTDQVIADFFTEIVAPPNQGDLKAGWTPMLLRDGYYVHLGWRSPKGTAWGAAWWYSLVDFAADCAKGNGIAKGSTLA